MEEKPSFRELVKAAIIEGLEVVRDFEARNKNIKTYEDYPEMVYRDDGFPFFWKKREQPRDYTTIFNDHRSHEEEEARKAEGQNSLFGRFQFQIGPPSIPSDQLPSWRAYLNYVLNNPRLNNYWNPTEMLELADSLGTENILAELIRRSSVKRGVFEPLRQLLNRYIHISGKREFDEVLFDQVSIEWARASTAEKLYFDIYVPILFHTFDFDSCPINDSASIERMDDSLQLARNTRYPSRSRPSTDMLRAATHALALKIWTIENKTREERQQVLNSASAFSGVIERIDKFFAALRSITDIEVGYGQLVIQPDGWADSWYADLAPVYVIAVKSYPEHFNERWWFEKPEPIAESDCLKVGDLFTRLLDVKNNKLDLAVRRLNNASLRAEEEDSILDIAIGLEVLLVTDKTEVTHKLATRLATLSRIRPYDDATPHDVYRYCKSVYQYRSDIAHGNSEKNVQKSRVIKLKEEEAIPTVTLGIKLLSYAIQVLSAHPQYLRNPEELDKLMLNGGDMIQAAGTDLEVEDKTSGTLTAGDLVEANDESKKLKK